MRRWLRPLWIFLALLFLVEAWLWDHLAPPVIDQWGPGARVPTLVISPFAKRGFVDKTVYDTTAILKLIETRYSLVPLASRDAASGDMTSALDLTR